MDAREILAQFWADKSKAGRHLKDAESVPSFVSVYEDVAPEWQLESFLNEVIDLRVVVAIDDCLRNASPIKLHMLSTELKKAIQHYRENGSLRLLNNFAVFAPIIHAMTYREVRLFVEGLKEYPEFAHIDDWTTEVSEQEMREAFAVVQATVALESASVVVSKQGRAEVSVGRERVYFKDHALVTLLRKRASEVNELVEIVRSNPGASADLVIEIFEHEQKPLRDGLL